MGEAKLTYMMNNANDTAHRILREDVISTAIGEHMVKVCKNMCQVGVPTNRLIRWTETMAAVIRTKSAEQQSLFPSKKVRKCSYGRRPYSSMGGFAGDRSRNRTPYITAIHRSGHQTKFMGG